MFSRISIRIFIVSVLFASLSSAQIPNIQFDHITTKDGLSNDHVWAIHQDRDGFMWFGTEGGLNRYDGRAFKVYDAIPGDSTTLDSRWVQAICEDSDGNLWVGARSLHKYNRDREAFTQYPLDARARAGSIRCLLYDTSGTIWIGTSAGLLRLDVVTGEFERIKPSDGGPEFEVLAMADDLQGNLLLVGDSRSTLLRLDKKTLAVGVVLKGFSGGTSVYVESCDILWIGTLDGLLRFDVTAGRTVRFGAGRVNKVQRDYVGRLWAGTEGGGLNLVDETKGRFVPFMGSFSHFRGAQGSWVHTLLVDRSGTIWVGTNNGVSKASKWSKAFRYYTHNPTDSNSVVPGEIRCVLEESDEKLWLGAYGNKWSRFDPVTNTFRSYTSLLERGGMAYMMYQDRSGSLWAGGGGLRIVDPRTNTIRRRRLSSTVDIARVEDILEDRHGIFWVATWRMGILRYDRTGETFRQYLIDTTLSKDKVQPPVVRIHEDRSGRLWISTHGVYGTNYGLFEYNRQLDRFEQRLRHVGKLGSRVHSIYEDEAGKIWMGLGRGLGLYDAAADSVVPVISEDRPNYAVFGILEDSHGTLWMSTYRGLSAYNPKTRTLKDYLFPGLSLWPVQVGYCRTRMGEFVFGLGEGFVMFHPDSIRDNPIVPPVVITEFRLFDQPVGVGNDSPLKKSILETNRIDLSYDQNTITFEFAALDFTAPAENQYAYQLEGFDKEWAQAGTRNQAHFTNMPPGEYVFRVKGSNNDGVWNEEGASVVVIITPPWWKTMWAYGGYLLAVLGMLYTIRRSEKNRDALRHQMEIRKVEAEKLREVDQIKSRFFANISHEFRTPLTLIKGPLEGMLAEEREPESRQHLTMMQRNADRLLRLINQLLDLSKLESGAMKLRASKGNIVSFVKGITSSFESSAGIRGIRTQTETDSDEITAYFDRDKLEKVLSNLLSNAFKFTPDGGHVTVSIRKGAQLNVPTNGDSVEVVVADTGIGIPAEELPRVFDRFYQVDQSQTRVFEGSGIGLALTKELVELHHGTITVRSEVAKGTEFILMLPLGREHLKADEVVEAEGVEEEDVPKSFVGAFPAEGEARQGRHESPLQGRWEGEKGVNTSVPIVLIVEDNADVRRYMREYLDKGYQVIEAYDGAEGIAKAKETIPDLIISDVMMPKKDGYEVCRTLKLDERTSHVPIILLTARAGTDSRIEGLETGADDYLTKPFDAKELLIRVRNLIELRRRLRERFSVGQVLKPGEIAVTSMDDAFLQKVKATVEARMEDESFSVEELGREVGMSRSQLHRKLTALTNLTPTEFTRYLRLQRAMDLLKQNAGTVAEIAYSVGFGSVSYFTQAFKAQFGIVPSEVKRNPSV